MRFTMLPDDLTQCDAEIALEHSLHRFGVNAIQNKITIGRDIQGITQLRKRIRRDKEPT